MLQYRAVVLTDDCLSIRISKSPKGSLGMAKAGEIMSFVDIVNNNSARYRSVDLSTRNTWLDTSPQQITSE